MTLNAGADIACCFPSASIIWGSASSPPPAISAVIAYLALARTLFRLDYLTFIANNPAVRIRKRAATAF